MRGWLIPRETQFSHGKQDADLGILAATATVLAGAGHAVSTIAPADFLADRSSMPPEFILAMSETKSVLERMQDLADTGCLVLNPPSAIWATCQRESMLARLRQSNVRIPGTYRVATLTSHIPCCTPVWIKRADYHRLAAEDVSLAADKKEAVAALRRLARLGCDNAIIQAHCPGSLVKCYMVGGKLIQANSAACNVAALEDICSRAGRALGLAIYGVDVIIQQSGQMTVIDVNDWPSFSTCTQEAATSISRLIERDRTTRQRTLFLTEDIMAAQNRYLIPGHQQIWEKSGLVIDHASFATVWDTSGRAYIDLWAGGGVCSVGHAHPEFTRAVYRQLKKGIVGSHPSAARSAYIADLAAVLPEPLTKIQLYTSGAEAVEAALRLARSYTRRPAFLGFQGSFHGKTLGALSLGDWAARTAYGPLAPGFAMAPFPVTGPAGPTGADGRLSVAEYLDAVRAAIAEVGQNALAGIVIEPVQGTAGNHFPPVEFLDRLRDLAHEAGALLIFDEIITGFGRTGRFFVSGSRGPVPDIMIIGKGMGNGMPISGIATTGAIGSSLPFAGPSGSSTSYGGNPLSAAAAAVTLEILHHETLPGNAAKVGIQLLSQLSQGLAGNPFVLGPWGEGLLIGLELVDPRTGQPLAPDHCADVFHSLLRSGILAAAYTPKIRLNPPLCLTADEAAIAANSIVRVLNKIALQA